MTAELVASIAAALLFMSAGYGIGHLRTRRIERARARAMIEQAFDHMELAKRLEFLERCEREGRDCFPLRRYLDTTPLSSRVISLPLPPFRCADCLRDLPGAPRSLNCGHCDRVWTADALAAAWKDRRNDRGSADPRTATL
jgi:hypothetical protein